MIENVCKILGYSFDSWKDLRSILNSDSFIPSLLNFDVKNFSAHLKNAPEKENSIHTLRIKNLDNVFIANRACGNLATWANAFIDYFLISQSVQPLKQQIIQSEEIIR